MSDVALRSRATDPPVATATAAGAGAPAGLVTADGRRLRVALARAEGRARRRSLLLVLPLLIFVLVTFVAPIGQMLHRSVHNPGFSANMPNLVAWFAAHPRAAPDEAAFAALAADLVHLKATKAAGIVGTRINYEVPGSRSLFTGGARGADDLAPPFREALLREDEAWGDPSLWGAMRGAATAYSTNFLLAAVDLERDPTGAIARVPQEQRVYLLLFGRTLWIAGLVTLLTLLLGFPIAHLLATLPLRRSNFLMILVLLPFWTSLLVRTTAWMVLLQQQGVINDLLVWTGVIGDDGRIQMIYNRLGTLIAMTHILLPFAVLPLYAVMRPIDPTLVRAARSLGASSWTAFRRIYLPQTVPGVAAGALLVFILAVGYYITPALVGGAEGQLISNLIAFHMQKSLNWSLAAALAALLLGGVLVLYWLYDRLVGIDNLKLG